MKPLSNVRTNVAPLTAKHPLYPRWRTMINRCFNPKNASYKRYGARGITVCEQWLSFPTFVDDMGIPPMVKADIDRRNNNGNYEPENCRWVTPKQNARNRSDNVVLSFNGMEKTVAEWAEHYGMRTGTLAQRLTRMPIEKALTRPLGKAKGEEFPTRTVLTDEDARTIKHSTEPLKVVAAKYGVSLSTVSGIRTGATWKHIS